MGFYEDMQGVATSLLTEFKQGTITLVRETQTPGTDPWDAPSTTETTYTLNATARGVSQKYVDGTNILRTDGQITMAVQATDPNGTKVDLAPNKDTDRLTIDGKELTMLSVEPKPRAGTPAAYVIIYRG